MKTKNKRFWILLFLFIAIILASSNIKGKTSEKLVEGTIYIVLSLIYWFYIIYLIDRLEIFETKVYSYCFCGHNHRCYDFDNSISYLCQEPKCKCKGFSAKLLGRRDI